MFYCPPSDRKAVIDHFYHLETLTCEDNRETEIKMRYIHTDLDDCDVFKLAINRKITFIKGDQGVPDEDELVISPMKTIRPRMKQSLFNELADMDINVIKEREFTPPQRVTENENKEAIEDNRGNNSFTKENMGKMLRSSLSFKKHFNIKSTKDSVIRVPDGYTTEDYDLKFLCDLINEEPNKNNGWVNVMGEKLINVYKKTVNNFLTIV
jgi:hypothetical protein